MIKCVSKEKYRTTTFFFSWILPSVISWGFLLKKQKIYYITISLICFTIDAVDKFPSILDKLKSSTQWWKKHGLVRSQIYFGRVAKVQYLSSEWGYRLRRGWTSLGNPVTRLSWSDREPYWKRIYTLPANGPPTTLLILGERWEEPTPSSVSSF